MTLAVQIHTMCIYIYSSSVSHCTTTYYTRKTKACIIEIEFRAKRGDIINLRQMFDKEV